MRHKLTYLTLTTLAATGLTLGTASVAPAATSSQLAPHSVCEPNGQGCTKGGTYRDPNALINANAQGTQVRITWTSTSVRPYSSGVPLYWTVGMTYHNYGSQTNEWVCSTGGWQNANNVREYMRGGSGDDGYVASSSTTCSQNPNKTWELAPGGSFTVDATFHNVPWPGSTVSILWGQPGTPGGQSAYINPFIH